MFKLLVISFLLLAGQVWSISLIHQLDEQSELAEADNDGLNDLEHYNDTINPEEMGGHFEGDILIPKQSLMMRSGIIGHGFRWPNATVPYEFGAKLKNSEMKTVNNAFNNFHLYTCIRFVPRTTEQDYISIVNKNVGCSSFVGRIGGKQFVNLQSPYCFQQPGTSMHELMRAIGFFHEQNRADRNDFVTIQYENISKETKFCFDLKPNSFDYGVPYDYGSVMHYPATAFSTNGQPTIIPKKSLGGKKMGQRKGLSAFDIKKIRQMYDCGKAAQSAD